MEEGATSLLSWSLETSLGTVPVWGDPAPSTERPAIFVVRGAFAEVDLLWRLPLLYPQADVALVHLPGMHTPLLRETSIAAFAQAFDEVCDQWFGERKPIVLGLSTGALCGLAMRRGRYLLAIDPPLQTAPLWPLLPRFLETGPQYADWVWRLFGAKPGLVENRDYRPLLASFARPGEVIVAGESLEPERPIDRLPGLITADDRERLGAHATLRATHVLNCGHNLLRDAPSAVHAAMRRALNA